MGALSSEKEGSPTGNIKKKNAPQVGKSRVFLCAHVKMTFSRAQVPLLECAQAILPVFFSQNRLFLLKKPVYSCAKN